MSDLADEDLRDVFKLLYDSDDWAMDDDEESVAPTPKEGTIEPEVEQVEVDLEDPTERLQSRYSRKRFMDDLNEILGPTSKRQRIYTPVTLSSSTSIPCTSPVPPLPSPFTYAPFSPLPLLTRLRTFEPASYSPNIPSPLDAVSAALSGWMNDGRDTLSCGVCKARWDLKGVAEIREESVRVEVARRLGRGLENKHRVNCSWRIRRSPDALYGQLRRLLHSPVTSNLSDLASALEEQCIARAKCDFRWTSPLTSTQTDNLVYRLKQTERDTPETQLAHTSSPSLSSFAAALALFCWYPFHPNGPSQTVGFASKRTDIVQCRLCERRVGLWNFRSTGKSEGEEAKVFDLVGEHRGWCPVRDTAAGTKWWEDLPLLKRKEKGSKGDKDWIRLSGKLEVKPWRRVRNIGSTAL